MTARARCIALAIVALVAASCGSSSSYVRDAGASSAPRTASVSSECAGLEDMLLDEATYAFSSDMNAALNQFRALDDVDPRLADLLLEMGTIGQTMTGAERALEIGADLDRISHDACDVPLLSAMMVMFDATLAPTRCISSASECGRTDVELPEALPCFENSPEPVGVYELDFIATNCATGEPTRWDNDAKEWVFDDDPHRERDWELFGGGIAGGGIDAEWEDEEWDPNDWCRDVVDGSGSISASEPRSFGGRIVALGDCSVVGLDADGETVAWELECEFSAWVSPIPGQHPNLDVLDCGGELVGVDGRDGSVQWTLVPETWAERSRVGPAHLAQWSEETGISVWSLETGDLSLQLPGVSDSVLALSESELFYSDDSGLHSVSLDSGAPLWDNELHSGGLIALNGVLYSRSGDHHIWSVNRETGLSVTRSLGPDREALLWSDFMSGDQRVVALVGLDETRTLSVYDSFNLDLLWKSSVDIGQVDVGEGFLAATFIDEPDLVVYHAFTGAELTRVEGDVFGRPAVHNGWVYYTDWASGAAELVRVALPG